MPTSGSPRDEKNSIFNLLFEDELSSLCRDIPESACRHQASNIRRHMASLAASKIGDGLSDPKLVLAWLLNAVGVPAAFIGMLVPIREALALLPQLLISPKVRACSMRKHVWAVGSLTQGLAVIGLGLTSLFLSGRPAGWAALLLIAVFALARSVSSVSYKDVLGKTVSKNRRGTVTGAAGTLSSAIVLIVSALLAAGVFDRSADTIAIMVILAGLCWILGAISFRGVVEEPGATEGSAGGWQAISEQFALLKQDAQFSRFVATRSLLISTALAPPFYLMGANLQDSVGFGSLGVFMLASSMASILSSYVWGRLADRSSRQVLMLAAPLAVIANLAVVIAVQTLAADSLRWPIAACLFVLMIAHQGVRLGRSTHLVDMADPDKRASYTALSNSIVGVVLLAGSVFGLLAQFAGPESVLAVFSIMAGFAAWMAKGLQEVQRD